MKKNLFAFLFALVGVFPTVYAQWSEGNFRSSRETILPPGVFEAGNDGTKPYYIAKIVFNGATYITKIGKGWTAVSVPHGNTVANIGIIGATNNPFQVFCGDVDWVSAGNGTVPANAVVVPLASGNAYIAKLNVGPSKTTVGWVPVGQSEAQYLDQGILYRSSNYQLLTRNAMSSAPEAPLQENRRVLPDSRRVLPNNPSGTRNREQAESHNMNSGGVTISFVYENGRAVSGEDTFVAVTVFNSATRVKVGNYKLNSPRGELPITNLAPGNYDATITARYEENTSGNREGWTTTVNLSYSPNPFNFSIRGGTQAVERVMLLRK